MSDLISRTEVVEHFQRLKEASETNGQYNEGFVDGLDFCISFISTLPSAEPKKGKWIDRNGATVAPFWKRYECSVCGARSDNSNYCPNCGAKMEADHE